MIIKIIKIRHYERIKTYYFSLLTLLLPNALIRFGIILLINYLYFHT